MADLSRRRERPPSDRSQSTKSSRPHHVRSSHHEAAPRCLLATRGPSRAPPGTLPATRSLIPMTDQPDTVDPRRDLDRAVGDLAERLPQPRTPLARLAYNFAWTWLPDGGVDDRDGGATPPPPPRRRCRLRRARDACDRGATRISAPPPCRRLDSPPNGQSPISAPSSACTARCRSTVAGSASWRATATPAWPSTPSSASAACGRWTRSGSPRASII